MLHQLLDILKREGTCSVDELARRLQVTRPLVEMMIEELVRMGRLAPAAATCSQHCDGCSAGSCQNTGGSARVWTWEGEE